MVINGIKNKKCLYPVEVSDGSRERRRGSKGEGRGTDGVEVVSEGEEGGLKVRLG